MGGSEKKPLPPHAFWAAHKPALNSVVSIAVSEGQEVKAGETLGVVEAIKMQNVLRAERDGVVKKIHATAGAR